MYLKKVDGPRAVRLPDGTMMTRADLPPPDTSRWVASRKAAVVKAVLFKLITRDVAIQTYALSDEELDRGITHAVKHGHDGLKAAIRRQWACPGVPSGKTDCESGGH